jgi:hypothetical protein
MRYQIVLATGTPQNAADGVQNQVTNLIAEGWQPLGGSSIAGMGDGWVTITQTMVK